MKFALVEVINKKKRGAMNKDLAGGMGTYSSFGNKTFGKLLTKIKRKYIRIPIISLANLQAILKEKGHEVKYYEGELVDKEFDVVIIYSSIVDYTNENNYGKKVKEKYPDTKVGFFGPFSNVKPKKYSSADFIIFGEVESYFMNEFKSKDELNGLIKVKSKYNLDDLPNPDFDGFKISTYSYYPVIKEKPFLPLQASKGCPYSCGYYCPYGTFQGKRYNLRSAEKTVSDIEHVVNKYGVKGIQFRDPTFGMNKKWLHEFIDLMKKKKLKVKWGMETRLDLLDKKIVKALFDVGLRNINIGVETYNVEVSKVNKRLLIEKSHQESLINYCKKIGVRISAFYIIGLIGDTKESVKRTIDYAKKLNTNVAQFAVSIPYPGSQYYEDMAAKGLVTESDYEKFNSAEVVIKHDKMSKKDIEDLKEMAFKKYYFRPKYLLERAKWAIRGFWL